MGKIELRVFVKRLLVLFATLFWFLPVVLYGAVPRNGTEEILSREVSVFINNENCEASGTCDLKEFKLEVKKSRMWVIDGWHYGSSIVASYETDFVGNLENYSFVQFIRGCIFDTSLDPDGKVTKFLGHSIAHFAEFDERGNPKDYKTFCFPEWTVDSIDKDPVYGSFPSYGRFYARRWNKVPGSYGTKTARYYGEEKPSYPLLYVFDTPSGAFLGSLNAVNASLEFKMCIYKSQDVPLEAAENDIGFAEPIKCFSWRNIYIYNYEKNRFEEKSEIDDICLRKPSK